MTAGVLKAGAVGLAGGTATLVGGLGVPDMFAAIVAINLAQITLAVDHRGRLATVERGLQSLRARVDRIGGDRRD